jgi:hypothetical protein
MVQGRKPSKVQPKVRLPSDLHKRLVQQANKGRRSLNQEIVMRLEESFTHEGTAAMRDAILSAHDERKKELQTAIVKQQAMAKSLDAKLEELKRLTELLKVGINR